MFLSKAAMTHFFSSECFHECAVREQTATEHSHEKKNCHQQELNPQRPGYAAAMFTTMPPLSLSLFL